MILFVEWWTVGLMLGLTCTAIMEPQHQPQHLWNTPISRYESSLLSLLRGRRSYNFPVPNLFCCCDPTSYNYYLSFIFLHEARFYWHHPASRRDFTWGLSANHPKRGRDYIISVYAQTLHFTQSLGLCVWMHLKTELYNLQQQESHLIFL